MNKVLIVFYSYSGTCRRVSSMLSASYGWPTTEIIDVQPHRSVWRCMVDSLLRRRPEIRCTGPSPDEFEAVVLVTPVWAYRLAGPMRSFVAQHGSQLPAAAVVSAMASNGAFNAEAEVATLTGQQPFMTLPILARHVEDGTCAEQLQAFADAIQAIDVPGMSQTRSGFEPRAAA